MERRIVLIAHNIRSLWNVGSLFRTCDSFAVEKIYLTGYTATPPRREISKTALGAEEWVPWEQAVGPVEITKALRADGWSIVALEQSTRSQNLMRYKAPGKVCLLLGNEINGVLPELMRESDDVIEIPMLGRKESLNVAVAAGIALHYLRHYE